jgi:RHS repeat-associated protein
MLASMIVALASPAAATTPTLANGAVSLLAGSGSAVSSAGSATTAGFNNPKTVVTTGGFVYSGNNDSISKVSVSTGATTILAGQPGGSCTETDGATGATSTFCNITAMATDGTYLYEVVYFQTLRKTSLATGATTTLGTFAEADSLTYASDGNLYLGAGGYSASAARIMQVNPGTGASSLYVSLPTNEFPTGLTADGTALWATTTVAGSCGSACSKIEKVLMGTTPSMTLLTADNSILADTQPVSLGGYLYTAATSGLIAGQRVLVRRYSETDGSAGSVAGSGPGYVNATGPDAWFASVYAVTSDGTNLFVADGGANNRIREIVPGNPVPTGQLASVNTAAPVQYGQVTTVATGFDGARGVAVAAGYAYVVSNHALYKVNLTNGTKVILAGSTTAPCSDVDANVATAVRFCADHDLVTDGHFVYMISGSFAHVRRTDTVTGATSTVYSSNGDLSGVTIQPNGTLLVSAGANGLSPGRIIQVDPVSEISTSWFTAFPAGEFPTAVAADSTYLWTVSVANSGYTQYITRVTLASPSTWSHWATDTRLNGRTIESAGNYLYASTSPGSYSGALLSYDKTTGAVTAVAGSSQIAVVDGTGPAAGFGDLTDVASDGTNLFVADDSDWAGVAPTGGALRMIMAVKLPTAAGGPTLPGETSPCDCNPSEHTTQDHRADPVNTATGGFTEQATDLALPGRGAALAWTRAYGSLAPVNGPLGYGWTTSYGAAVTVDPLRGVAPLATSPVVDVVQDNGTRVEYIRNTGGTYSAATRVLSTLVQNGDGTWTFVQHTQNTFTFSAAGQLTKITDRNGYTTTLGYDGSNRLSTLTDPAGLVFTLAYNAASQIASVTDTAGRQVQYTYDAAGNLQTVTDPAGKITTYGYDPGHHLTTVTDPRNDGNVVNVYDFGGRVTQQTDPAGRVTQFAYSIPTAPGSLTTTITNGRGYITQQVYSDGELTSQTAGVGTPSQTTTSYTYDPVTNGQKSMTDGNNHTWQYLYDAAGNRTQQTDPLTQVTKWTYNPLDEVVTTTDPLNVVTTNTYDTHGNLLTTSTPLVGSTPLVSKLTTNTYGDVAHPGDVTQVTDPRGKVWTSTYDSYGQLTASTDPLGDKTTSVYTCATGCRNNVGWVYSSVSPRGNVSGGTPSQFTTTFTRDDMGRVLTVSDPLGHVTTNTYDGDGNLTSVKDPDNRLTQTTYNPDNQVTMVTRNDGTTQLTGYDANGNMATQTDGLTHVTTYGHDPLDRTTTVTDALSRVTGYGYDPVGNLTTITQPGPGSTTLTTTKGYDLANQLKTITYSDGVTHSVAYTYDADGQRKTMIDGTGTTTYTVDSLHRLTAMTNGGGRAVAYGYDLGGNVTSLTYPGAKVLTRTFNDNGQLISAKDWLATPTTNTFGYDNDGNWNTTTYGNTDTATRTFNNADQLTALTYKKGATTLGTLTYTRSSAGLLATTTPSAGAPGTTDTYTYNPRAQLTSRDNSGTTWAYDNADRTTKTLNGATSVTLAYDNADQLTTATPTTGAATTYTYDNRGNRTASLVTGAGSSTTYAYNQAGNLTGYTPAGGTVSTYGYDGDGLRANKTPAGGAIAYMAWDTVTSSVPLLLSDYASTFIYGPGGIPVEQIKGTVNTYVMGDQLGSTVLLTNSTGASSGTWTYDAYGATTVHVGVGTTPLLYQGQYQDSESSLYYLRARYYEPAVAQFLSRDALGAMTRAAYSYASGSPFNNADPTGNDAQPPAERPALPAGFRHDLSQITDDFMSGKIDVCDYERQISQTEAQDDWLLQFKLYNIEESLREKRAANNLASLLDDLRHQTIHVFQSVPAASAACLTAGLGAAEAGLPVLAMPLAGEAAEGVVAVSGCLVGAGAEVGWGYNPFPLNADDGPG